MNIKTLCAIGVVSLAIGLAVGTLLGAAVAFLGDRSLLTITTGGDELGRRRLAGPSGTRGDRTSEPYFSLGKAARTVSAIGLHANQC